VECVVTEIDSQSGVQNPLPLVRLRSRAPIVAFDPLDKALRETFAALLLAEARTER
jgi:hypothetical protein